MRGERSTGRGRGSGKTTWRRWPLWGDLSGERRTPSPGKDKMTEGSGTKVALAASSALRRPILQIRTLRHKEPKLTLQE